FDSVAWISMMLVEESLRGRGIGRALMEQALMHVDASGIPTVRLDATPLGRPLYEKLGFRADFPLVRYAGIPDDPGAAEGILPVSVSSASALDQRVTGTNRRQLLELFDRDASLRGVVR